jgi:hypothetical protein
MALTPAEKMKAYRARLKQRALGQLPTAPILTNIPPEKRWKGSIDQAHTLLQTTREEMQSYFEERSEAWVESEKGEAFQERMDALDTLLEELNSLI